MTDLNHILLYVDNPQRSAGIYEKILEKAPQESHPTFVAFVLKNGLTLGLWSKHTAEPKPNFTQSSGEIAFCVKDNVSVDSIYRDWTRLGLSVAQKPTMLDFGYTFVLLDPDGHKLRVFCAHEE